MRKPRRGVSFGTILMLAVTVVVVGLSAAILPRLLGTADFDMTVDGGLSALTLDDSLTALSLNEIPISVPDPSPETTPVPEEMPSSPVPTAAPTAAPRNGKVTLTFGGSVNIDEAVRKSAYYSDSKKYDFTEIMMLLREEMQSDLTMLTLENVTDDSKKVTAVNAPSAVMDMLADVGVNILALGYPKACDLGEESLLATIEQGRKRGMTTLGAYSSRDDAANLRMFTVDGVKIAFLHYTDSLSSTGRKALAAARAEYALPTTKVDDTYGAMLAEIRGARTAGADIVVVSLNWGKASASKPTSAQTVLAQQIADAGADVIIGAGTRVVQPVDWLTSKAADGSIRHTLCAWSLGSLFNESRKDGNVAGMLLQLQISVNGSALSFEKVSYIPTYIWRYKQDGQFYYRITVSDQPAPDGMGDEQAGYMQKALRNVQKYLGDSPVTLRIR